MAENLDKSIQLNQDNAPEPEANDYQKLRESLERLGQVEPGLICETTKAGRPEVIVIPGRDNTIDHQDVWDTASGRNFRDNPEEIGDRDTVVAISDNKMRILRIRAPYFGRDANVEFAVSDLFRKRENGKVFTEEQIANNLRNGFFMGNFGREDSLDAKLKQLLKSLTNRNEQNAYNEEYEGQKPYWIPHWTIRKNDPKKLARYNTLKEAFDPETYVIGENLADRFNALVDQLSPSAQKDQS